ncbi:XRE family transcriptional regulator [Pseudomonas quasicaspiana]|uniref:XRE family transcriptional regulator n=2 Tax=Pseudomonas syringae group TaxID=136849 RepID=UPI0022285BA0|nr:LexA family transcriptional regulator [Pseudomonas quasicaspiana]
MSELIEIVAQRLKGCRASTGWTLEETARRLSALSGTPMTFSRFSNWELGLRMPPPDQLVLLAKLFGKTPAWLQGYTDNDSLSAASNSYVTANPPNIQTKNGLLSLTQAADSTAFSHDYIESRGMNRNQLLCIKQLDASMAPTIAEGDELLLDGGQTVVRGADLFGIVVAQTIWVRWICPELDGTFTLKAGDAQQYPDKILSKEALDELDIVGRVVRISHDR